MKNQLKSNYLNQPREVQIRIIFLRIGDIDTLNEKFYAEILIESKWEENKLANEFACVDSQLFSDEIEEYKELLDATKYWNPKLYVENALNETKRVHYKIRKELNNKSNTYNNTNEKQNQQNRHNEQQQQQQQQQPEESIQYAKSKNSFTYWLFEYQRIKGNFFEKLELDYFPVDIQDLSIVLTTAWSDKEVKLVEMRSKISSVKHNILDRHIWHLYHHIDVKTDYDPEHGDYNHAYNTITINNMNEAASAANVTNFCENCEETITTTRFNTLRNNAITYIRKLSSFPHLKEKSTYRDIIRHPLIKFQLKVARKSGYYYWNTYLLIFLITSVVFTTFSIDLDKPHFRLPVTATLLLTSVTFRWIYSGKCLPTVNYLTSLDKYSLVSLICIYVCLMWHGGFPFLLNMFGIGHDKLAIIDRYVCAFLVLFYVLVQIALVVWLRRAYLIRASLIKKDESYFKKALQYQLRNSMMENLLMEPLNSQANEKDKRISLFSINFNQHDPTAKQRIINDATKTKNKNQFYVNESADDDDSG